MKVEPGNGREAKVTGNLTIKGSNRPVIFRPAWNLRTALPKPIANWLLSKPDGESGRFFDLLADQTLADSILILLQKNDGTERVGYKTGLIVTPVETPDQFGLNGMEEIIFTQSQQVDRELFFTYGQRYVFGNNFFAGVEGANDFVRPAFDFERNDAVVIYYQ